MKNSIIFSMILFKLATAQAPVYQNFWIVWDVGQGQWVTHVSADECLHFDAGGEPGAFKRVRPGLIAGCGKKANRIFLSHWDMDHYLQIPFLARTLAHLCWQYRPKYGVNKISAQKILNLEIPFCRSDPAAVFWVPSSARTTNESSAVFTLDSVLLPGDSPTQQERIWARGRPELSQIKVLVLGHHGSRSSTGDELLTQLPRLKWAVASARWVRYRHPHNQTLMRLYEKNIPVLRTEDWGNIRFQN